MTMRKYAQGVTHWNSAGEMNGPLDDALAASGYASDRSDFAGWARGTAGSGSPKSANAGAGLAAPIGHLYTDTTATDGRGHWLKVGGGNRQWVRVKDQVNAGAVLTTAVDGVTDNATDLIAADLAAVAAGVPLYLNPFGTYFIGSTHTFNAKWVVPKGAVIKRAANAYITFAGGIEAGPYQVLDNSLVGSGGFWIPPGSVTFSYIQWWGVLGNAYSVEESANWQFCEDQTPDGAEIRGTPGMQINLAYPVRFYSVSKFWNFPPNYTDADAGGAQVKWTGDDTGVILNLDRAAMNTFRGLQVQQWNADTSLNFEMSTVGFTAGNNTITALGDGYNGVLLPAPWTFKPSDVGKQIFIQASIGGVTGTHTITGFVANPANGVKGTQITVSPAPDASINFMKYSLGTQNFGRGTNINSQNAFQDGVVNMFNIRDSVDVQGFCIARVSGSNNELHRFERMQFLGGDRRQYYGYSKYNNSSSTASMSVGSNLVTLAAVPTGQGAITPAFNGQMFRMGRVGTINDATVTVSASAAAGATTIAVSALTQMIPFDADIALNSGSHLRLRADAPVGATSLTVVAIAAAINAGDFGADGGKARANNDGSYGAGQGTITTVPVTVNGAGAAQNATAIPVAAITYTIPAGTLLTFASGKTATLSGQANAGATSLPVGALAQAISAGDVAADPLHFTVNFNASQTVSGVQCQIYRNKGRGGLIGPSFNVHHITFDQCLFQGFYRSIVCFGGGVQVKGVYNTNNADCNWEIGGNNAHPMNLGYMNSENSGQQIISSSLVPIAWEGRCSGEGTYPGKGQFEIRANAGQAGLDYGNGVCGALETLAKSGGSCVWDIRNAGGIAIFAHNVQCNDITGNPITDQRVGLDAEVNGMVFALNAFGHQFKIWGMPFSATPRVEIGGLPLFSLYQDTNPRNDLALAQFAFRRGGGGDTSVYVDMWMDFSTGIQTAAIRPKNHNTSTRGYAPTMSDAYLRMAATQFLDTYVTLDGGSNPLPGDWECAFRRVDTWPAQACKINVITGGSINGVVENGTGNASISLAPGDKVRLVNVGTHQFEVSA